MPSRRARAPSAPSLPKPLRWPMDLPTGKALLVAWAKQAPIDWLEKMLDDFDTAYTNSNTPFVTDAVYDIIKDVYLERVPNAPARVGAPVPAGSLMVPIPFYMGSLDKIKTDDPTVLDKWVKAHPGPYVISHKMDGISAELVWRTKTQLQLITRGDGKVGQDVTSLIPLIAGLPSNLKSLGKKGMAIRGELIMPVRDFEQGAYGANPRAVVAGIAKVASTPRSTKRTATWEDMVRHVHFLPYAILSAPDMPLDAQFEWLYDQGFEVTPSSVTPYLSLSELAKRFERARAVSPFEIDGLVVSVLHPTPHTADTNKNPADAFAFKLDASELDGIETTIEEVEWNLSKDGLYKPRIRVRPVHIGGAEITFCSGKNARYIQDNRLGPGAIVRIVRSGDVIPEIQAIVKPLPKSGPLPAGGEWDATQTEWILPVQERAGNVDVVIKQLAHAIKTLGVEGVSEQTMAKCVRDGGYESLAAILSSPSGALAALPGLGDKTEEAIRAKISTALLSASPSVLMVASGAFGHGVGVRVMDTILNAPVNAGWSVGTAPLELDGIWGIGPSIKNKITSGWAGWVAFYESVRPWRASFRRAPSSPPSSPSSEPTSPFLAGEVVVFTGFRSKDLEEQIERRGGRVGSSVTGKTTLLVYSGDRASTKVKAAEAKGIPIMERGVFEARFA